MEAASLLCFLKTCYNSSGIVRVSIYEFRLITELCNKSAIRLGAVDLPERAKGAVKNDSGSWTYRGLGRVLRKQNRWPMSE